MNSEPAMAAVETPQQSEPQAERQYEYKTILIYDDKLNETLVSIQPPQVSPARMLHFLLRDRFVVRNIDKIRGWSTEMLGEITQGRIITGEK